jgi:hypothetical protein
MQKPNAGLTPDLQGIFNINLICGATHSAVFAGSAVWMKFSVACGLNRFQRGLYCYMNKQNRDLAKTARAEK